MSSAATRCSLEYRDTSTPRFFHRKGVDMNWFARITALLGALLLYMPAFGQTNDPREAERVLNEARIVKDGNLSAQAANTPPGTTGTKSAAGSGLYVNKSHWRFGAEFSSGSDSSSATPLGPNGRLGSVRTEGIEVPASITLEYVLATEGWLSFGLRGKLGVGGEKGAVTLSGKKLGEVSQDTYELGGRIYAGERLKWFGGIGYMGRHNNNDFTAAAPLVGAKMSGGSGGTAEIGLNYSISDGFYIEGGVRSVPISRFEVGGASSGKNREVQAFAGVGIQFGADGVAGFKWSEMRMPNLSGLLSSKQ